MSDHLPAFCSECKRPYQSNEDPPCPACGSSRRTFDQLNTATLRAQASVSGVHTRQGYPRGWVTKFVERTKISRLGKLARESLRFDRSDPDKTVKTHRVEEQQADGDWKVVHDEEVEYPAKRRSR
jgi:hypothetical protein